MKYIIRLLSSVFVIILFFPPLAASAAYGGGNGMLPTTAPAVVDIDMDNFLSEMAVGDTQLLMPTALPLGAPEQVFVFASSDTEVAVVNLLGRITALRPGQATISITAGEITRSFLLRVVLPTTVADIDMGDLRYEMYVGSTQLLMPTLLPLGIQDYTITYMSSNMEVATVNMMGRVTARAVGSSVITVSAGGITRNFMLMVVEEEPAVRVNYIEISDFEDEISVGDTITISATPLPADAEEQRVTFLSSNPRIATINSAGRIEGISAGVVTISVQADGFTRSLRLTVREPTGSLGLNSTFAVLRVGDSFGLEVSVYPDEVDSEITFRSFSPSIAYVSDDGVITAIQTGTASVQVSTWDASRIVNVIVIEAEPEAEPLLDIYVDENEQVPLSAYADLLSDIMQPPDGGEITVDWDAISLLDAEILRALMDSGNTLIISHHEYLLKVSGQDIRNPNNVLLTGISFIELTEGTELIINEGRPLPGAITIQLLADADYRFLYLFNDSSNRFEMIGGTLENNVFTIEHNGRYLVAESLIPDSNVNWLIVGAIGSGTLLAGAAAYIATKKRHWFW
jgi:uncharacterized protein YjdB